MDVSRRTETGLGMWASHQSRPASSYFYFSVGVRGIPGVIHKLELLVKIYFSSQNITVGLVVVCDVLTYHIYVPWPQLSLRLRTYGDRQDDLCERQTG